MAERSRRVVKKHGQNRAAGALAQLAELRRTGKKQTELFELKEEDDIYDEVDEAEYNAKKFREREDGDDGFVVNDGIGGYDSMDEEEDDFSGDDAGELRQSSRPVKVAKPVKEEKKGSKRKADGPAKGDKNRIGKMFAKHAGVPGNVAAKNDPKTGQASDALLDDILGELGGPSNPSGARTDKPIKKEPVLKEESPTQAVPHAQRSSAVPASNALKKKAKRAKLLSNPLLADEKPDDGPDLQFWDAPEEPADDDMNGEHGPELDDTAPAGEPAPSLDGMDHKDEADGLKIENVGDLVSETHEALNLQERSGNPGQRLIQPEFRRRLQSGDGENLTPKGRLQELKSEGKTPWKTPPPVFSEPETPQTAAPAAGWQQHCDEEDGNELVQELQEEFVDDGSLPLDESGALPFYFLDAHEEYSTPELVYLFGKVRLEGKFLSCCARVKCPQRAVFFVPSPGLVPDDDEMLQSLEEAYKDDSSQRGPLLKYVHSLLSETKAEVRSVLSHHGISNFVIKPVKRDYAFEMACIPRGKQWVLKVRLPSTAPTLPLGLTGEYFVATLGSEQSMLEALMLKRKIMGPSWLSIAKPTRIDSQAQVSWCKLELEISSPKNVTSVVGGSDPPPIVVAALSLKTAINVTAGTNEIAAASCVYLRNVKVDRGVSQAEWNNSQSLRHFSVVRKLDGRPFPPGFEAHARKANESAVGKRNGGCVISAQGSERALLAFLLAKLQELDADVYTGHNISGFDIDILLHRLQAHKMPNWSRIGRLKRSKMPNLTGGGHSYGGGAGPGVLTVLAGRMLCDTYLAARDLVKEVDYTLKTLARSLLNQERNELSASDLPAKYESSQKLMELVQHAESDAWLSLGLSFYLNFLPLTLQLSQLSGSLWSKALQGQRAQRIEMLLLHEFHRQKFMLPDKMRSKDRERLTKAAAQVKRENDGEMEIDEPEKPEPKKGKGPQYAGGLVLEPKKGLYDKFVLLLDFNSLYPSIMQEYNICFTTVEPAQDGHSQLPQPSSDLAPLPKVIQQLVRRRRGVKDALSRERDPLKRAQMDIRQQALKLTANSMYGCLGFTHSRFYARPLAELITSQGREILQSTVDLVQSSIGAEVIYGDTDSIMIASNSTNLEEVRNLGQKVKREVNKRYKLLEIEIDGVFKCMLLLKKKKYAAVKLDFGPNGAVNEILEQKGLDIVRRDWCPLSKDVGNFALEKILSGQAPEDVVNEVHAKLQEVREKMDKGLIPLHKFIITKQLTKRPDEYPDAQNQPHVQVAIRRAKAHKKDGVAQGETVPYIICAERSEDGTEVKEIGKGIAERAFHPEELRESKTLTVDAPYYLANQVHPVVSRLCAPIEGTDAARLADCLGLDPAKFRGQVAADTTAEDMREEALLSSASMLDDDVLYKDCEPLILRNGDGDEWEFKGVQNAADGRIHSNSLLVPPHAIGAEDGLTPAQLSNQVQLQMRRQIAKYYDCSLRSDDELQLQQTRNISCRTQGDSLPGSLSWNPQSTVQMSQVYSDSQLYRQLAHYGRLLDPGKALRKVADAVKREDAERELVPVRAALETACVTVRELQARDKYQWVSMRSLCA